MDRGQRTLRAEELAGDVQGLASHDDDLLAVEQLLGDRGGQATEKVALSVDDLRDVLADSVLSLRACFANVRRDRGCVCSCSRGVRTTTGSKVDYLDVSLHSHSNLGEASSPLCWRVSGCRRVESCSSADEVDIERARLPIVLCVRAFCGAL